MAKTNRRLSKPSSHTRLFSRVAAWDVAWGGISPLGAFMLRDGTIYSPGAVAAYCGIALLVALVVFQLFRTGSPIARFYSIRDALELLKACVLVAALAAVAVFLVTRLEEAPRSIPILHFLLLIWGLLGVRILARLYDAHRGARAPATTQDVQHVLVIQASRLAWFFSKMVEELAPGAFQIVAVLDERANMKHRSLNGYPIIGAPEEIDKVITDYATHGVRIDQVVLAARPDELAPDAWQEVCRVCRNHAIDLEVLPERLMAEASANDNRTAMAPPVADAANGAENGLPAPAPRDRGFWQIKRAIDFATALAVLIVMAPIVLVLGTLVLFDVGIPVVFWQQRAGRNGAPLYLYKFRTLQAPFDRHTKQRREAQSPSPIGRFLRATRLDELPQIWNILSGDMSLVGPRPLLPADQPKDATLRLSVRPGLTGWAQTCGGKLISAEEKTALDEWYIKHASLRLDAVIVLRTIRMLMTNDRRDEEAIATAMRESSAGAAGPLSAEPALPEADAEALAAIQFPPGSPGLARSASLVSSEEPTTSH